MKPRLAIRRAGLAVILAGLLATHFTWRDEDRGSEPERAITPAKPEQPAVTAPQPAVTPAAAAPAARSVVRELFSFGAPAEAEQFNRVLPVPARTVHYVRVDRALIEGKSSPFWQRPGEGRLRVPRPDGPPFEVVIDRSEMLGANRFSSTGHLEGRPLSQVVLAYNDGFLHGSIEDVELGAWALRGVHPDWTQFYQIDPGQVAPCGGERHPRAADSTYLAPASGTETPPTAALENPQRADVHVMMVYTQAVMAGVPGVSAADRVKAIQAACDAAIAKTNAAFETSQITARVRLVRIWETSYAADSTTTTPVSNLQDDALTALYRKGEAGAQMDDIHAARDEAGADIVCLMLNRPDAFSSGLSFLLDTPGDNANPQFAFSVVQYSQMTGTSVVPHELGHVFGCAHDRANALSGPGSYSFSYGYTFVASDRLRYHDIMAYPPGRELAYFSNPRINAPAPAPAGSPGGIAGGTPGESDSALTIELNAFEVSSYRLQTRAAANVGTLINVATLAYSGPGDQVLIGGFVVNGTRRKTILVRGVGPALGSLGVSNPLTDPQLTVFSGSRVIGTNDNWGAEAADAASRVGAFPFRNGSADAALVLSLDPGGYSAVVEGRNGGTGMGMIEVYDVDRTSDKIVNLSTRGYADSRGREMTAGFVVQAGGEATKRVLIRVRGPSLERDFGMTGTMYDPCLELRNASGQILILNDDWSEGSQRVAGKFDDFQPLVRNYGEQQMAATGLAPANRREPAVLVDLPPGNFTVIVKPFELVSSDPSVAQEAKPGVAVVEVYEINR
jgi:hypothetical protein